MKRALILLTLAGLIAGSSLVVLSCMGKEPEGPSLERLLKLGNRALKNNKDAEAYNYFKSALEIDANSNDAIWGTVIANAGRIIRNLDGLVDLLAGVYVYEPSREECEIACDQLIACGLTEDASTTPEECVAECPWGLQPVMFDAVTESGSCQEIRKDALEWVIALTAADCELLCNDLQLCGLLTEEFPRTYNLEECKARCPDMYVERHGMCYLNHLGECSRQDRTCFEHTIVGFQYLFQEFGATIPPEIFEFSDDLMTRPDVQYFVKYHAWHFTDPPLVLTLDGRYGQEELHFFRAIGHFFVGFIDLVAAVNLDINTVTFDILARRNSIKQFDMNAVKTLLPMLPTMMENVLYDPIFPGALIAKSDAESLAQITHGGREMGSMFDEFSQFLYVMMADTDRQKGKALGYDDVNSNFYWDPEEVLVFRDLMLFGNELSMNRYQADAIAAFSAGMAQNLLYRVPFKIDLFKAVLHAYDLDIVNFVIDLIADRYVENGEIDISRLFYEPKPTGFYDLLLRLIEILKKVVDLIGPPPAAEMTL
jgi:hypothetical protein